MQFREHLREHNCALHADFGPNNGAEYFARKQKEREDYYTGSSRLQAEVKQDVLSAIEKVSQGYKPQIQQEGDM